MTQIKKQGNSTLSSQRKHEVCSQGQVENGGPQKVILYSLPLKNPTIPHIKIINLFPS